MSSNSPEKTKMYKVNKACKTAIYEKLKNVSIGIIHKLIFIAINLRQCALSVRQSLVFIRKCFKRTHVNRLTYLSRHRGYGSQTLRVDWDAGLLAPGCWSKKHRDTPYTW